MMSLNSISQDSMPARSFCRSLLAVAIFAIATAGCGSKEQGEQAADGTVEATMVINSDTSPAADSPFFDTLRSISQEYLEYKLMRPTLDVAPTACRAPVNPGGVSKAEPALRAAADESDHGKKLYFLFARDADAY